MTVWEPDDEGLLGELEAIFKNVDIDDVVDLHSLPDDELLRRYWDIDEKLKQLNEVTQLTKTTREGRDLHSERSALVLILKERNLL